MSLFRLHRWLCGATIVLALFFSAGTDLYAQGGAYEDDKIKSVFIYNLTHFVSWPESAVSAPSANFGICLLGDDLFENVIDKVVENESVNGTPIAIKRANALAAFDLDTCHLLFIGEDRIDNLPAIIAQSMARSILTMGDAPGFADKGGMVNLVREKKRIKIEVNTEAVKKAGLKLNSKLLRLARIVDRPSPSGGE